MAMHRTERHLRAIERSYDYYRRASRVSDEKRSLFRAAVVAAREDEVPLWAIAERLGLSVRRITEIVRQHKHTSERDAS